MEKSNYYIPIFHINKFSICSKCLMHEEKLKHTIIGVIIWVGPWMTQVEKKLIPRF
jgi:hypothetical protein